MLPAKGLKDGDIAEGKIERRKEKKEKERPLQSSVQLSMQRQMPDLKFFTALNRSAFHHYKFDKIPGSSRAGDAVFLVTMDVILICILLS